MTHDELLDIVDDNDDVTGQMRCSEVYRRGLSNFRAVNVFLENSDGKLWIPRRTAHKRHFPSCLDMSMGGHVESGESYEEALERELLEELNINVQQTDCQMLGYLTPQAHGVSAFMKVYRIFTSETPSYNEADFLEAHWLSPERLQHKLYEGEPAKGDLAVLIERFYTAGKQPLRGEHDD